MRILALESASPASSPQAFAALAREEAAALWALVQSGVVRDTWFRSDRTDAVLLLECQDLEEARTHLATLPMVRAGLIDFELIGLRPYPGFARLFVPGDPSAR
jgi:hypothetical protein